MHAPERIVYLKSGEVPVKKGDSLSSIAARYNVSPKALASCNNLVNQQNLQGIQTLMLPGQSAPTKKPVDGFQPEEGPVLLMDDDTSIWSDEMDSVPTASSEPASLKSMQSHDFSTADVDLEDLENVVMGGNKGAESNQLPKRTQRPNDGRVERAPVQSQSKQKIVKFFRPVSGEITEYFQKNKRGAPAQGIKLKASVGTSVRAVADGKVVLSGKMPGDSSKVTVLIRHSDGWTSCYKALAESAVMKNTIVKQGDFLGTCQGPDLIFELRNPQRVAVDPALHFGQ